jgi:hypothetical protein
LSGVSKERSLTHTGENPVPFNVEFSGFDSQFQEVNCHRQQPVLIHPAGIMPARTGKHMSDAAGEALDTLASQFFLPEWWFLPFPLINPLFVSTRQVHSGSQKQFAQCAS